MILNPSCCLGCDWGWDRKLERVRVRLEIPFRESRILVNPNACPNGSNTIPIIRFPYSSRRYHGVIVLEKSRTVFKRYRQFGIHQYLHNVLKNKWLAFPPPKRAPFIPGILFRKSCLQSCSWVKSESDSRILPRNPEILIRILSLAR